MKQSLCAMALTLAIAFGHTAAIAAPALQTEFSNASYFPKDRLPVKKVAMSAINLRLGVHLERLTLLSGEGNTEKKIMSGLLAGALTMMGGRGGMDMAEKEPIEDHLSAADAQAMADDMAKILSEAIGQAGFELVPAAEVTASAPYGGVEGEAKITADTESVKGNLFKPSYFFGYHQVPVLGYKFRKKSSVMFGVPSDNASTRVREATGVPLTLAWSVNVVNDRKVMRVQELALNVWGQGSGAFSSGDDKPWGQVSVEPDSLSTPSGESHKNREYWAALAPQFAEAAKAMAQRVAETYGKPAGQ